MPNKFIRDLNSIRSFVRSISRRHGAVAIALLITMYPASTATADKTIEIPSALLTIVESADVSAARTGILAQILVREGDIVEAGQLIAELDSTKAAVAVEQAEYELRMAEHLAKNDIDIRYAIKSNDLAKSELERSLSVNANLPGTIPGREIDRLQLSLDRTVLEIEKAKSDLSLNKLKIGFQNTIVYMSELELKEHRFLAPITGVVVRIDKRPGEWVEPGETIVRIVEVDRIRAEGFINPELSTLDLLGHHSIIQVSVPGGRVVQAKGKITFVSPEANPVNGTVRIWAECEKTDPALRPGLLGKIIIEKTSPAIKNNEPNTRIQNDVSSTE